MTTDVLPLDPGHRSADPHARPDGHDPRSPAAGAGVVRRAGGGDPGPGLGQAGPPRPPGRHRRPLPVGPGRARAGPTPSTRRRSRPGPRAGRRSSSGRRTRRTSSPSTSRRPRCGSWRSRPASSGSTPGASWSPRPSKAWPRWPFSTPTVRRWFRPGAGLLAGAVLAITPVAALMFRYNNPDALLVLLLTVAAYATVRALERRPSTWWLVLAMSAGRHGFITKMLQAFLVVPALGLVYLIAAPTPLLAAASRSSLAAAVAVRVASGWWVAIVPAHARRPTGRTSGGPEQQPAEPDLRLQRPRSALGQRDRQRRAAPAQPGRDGAPPVAPFLRLGVRDPDLLADPGRADLRWPRPVVVAPAPADRPARAALLLWGGWLARHRPGVQLWPRASSTPTTRWPRPRPSAPWSASAPGRLWERRNHRSGPVLALAVDASPRCGPPSCSTGTPVDAGLAVAVLVAGVWERRPPGSVPLGAASAAVAPGWSVLCRPAAARPPTHSTPRRRPIPARYPLGRPVLGQRVRRRAGRPARLPGAAPGGVTRFGRGAGAPAGFGARAGAVAPGHRGSPRGLGTVVDATKAGATGSGATGKVHSRRAASAALPGATGTAGTGGDVVRAWRGRRPGRVPVDQHPGLQVGQGTRGRSRALHVGWRPW